MKKITLLATVLLSLNATAMDESRYFPRPLNCPLRFSSLSAFRDQVQTLVSSLGTGCTQNGQQAINQLNNNVSNLEGIANTYKDYATSSDATSSAQYAKNVGQILGSINLITSNNACFYDIRSRGALPVLADVIMSTSQLGLLIPTSTGAAVAAGGYVAGSSLKIINELLKKKFNFDKPEERRAFIQLNCAFFDNRRMLEESGIFNPESEDFRDQLVLGLRKERIDIIRAQGQSEKDLEELALTLAEEIGKISEAKRRNLDPLLSRAFDDFIAVTGRRPGDYAEKLRQVSFIAENAPEILKKTRNLTLDSRIESTRKLLIASLEKITPTLQAGGTAWTNNIDEHEMHTRGPLLAFLIPVADALKKELMTIEANIAITDPVLSKKIAGLRQKIRTSQANSVMVNLRLASIEAKIISFEGLRSEHLFSKNDEGSSNNVEILDYYRKLQNSILGDEGRDYLKNSLKTAHKMQTGLEKQLELMAEAKGKKEICAVAEKIRFAWTQYRYKVQEAHDFIETNFDLYRSTFQIGDESLKRSTSYVLSQIESVEVFKENKVPQSSTVGELMRDVSGRISGVEQALKASQCF